MHSVKMRWGILIEAVILIISMGLWGCAHQNSGSDVYQKETYKKMREQQRARQSIADMREDKENNILKNLPEMTAEDYDRLGDNYLDQGELDLALVQYNKALGMAPKRIDIRYKIGCLYLRQDLIREANNEFRNILKQDPNYALAYQGLGQSCMQMEKSEQAEKYLRQALKIDPHLWQSHNLLGIIYNQKGRLKEAAAACKVSINLKPGQGFLFNNLGISYFLNRDYENAVKSFEEALQYESGNKKIFNNLGLALCAMGRHEEGLTAFKRGGTEAKAYNNLGCLYLWQGRYQEAIDAFEKAMAINPAYYIKAGKNLESASAAKEAQ